MSSSATEVERLLQAARLHLAQGELHDAVLRATEAIRLNTKVRVSRFSHQWDSYDKATEPPRFLGVLMR
jgi:hypothetical protein